MDGNPPLGHERACSTEKTAPHAHLAGSLPGVSSHSAVRGRREMHPCVERSRVPLVGALSARFMILFPLLGSLLSSGWQIAIS